MPMIVIAFFGMLISSSAGVLNLYLSGAVVAGDALRVSFIRWMGDSIGVLLALPLVLNNSKTKLLTYSYQNSQLVAWLLFLPVTHFSLSAW